MNVRKAVRPMLLLFALAVPATAMIATTRAQPTARAETASTHATYRVKEMACHGCAERIQDSLRKRAGVSKVAADHKTDQVVVTFDRQKTNATEIKKALDKLGFQATLISEQQDKPRR